MQAPPEPIEDLLAQTLTIPRGPGRRVRRAVQQDAECVTLRIRGVLDGQVHTELGAPDTGIHQVSALAQRLRDAVRELCLRNLRTEIALERLCRKRDRGERAAFDM